MTDLGDVTHILGIEVKRNKEAGTIELDQVKYDTLGLAFQCERLQPSAYATDWKAA